MSLIWELLPLLLMIVGLSFVVGVSCGPPRWPSRPIVLSIVCWVPLLLAWTLVSIPAFQQRIPAMDLEFAIVAVLGEVGPIAALASVALIGYSAGAIIRFWFLLEDQGDTLTLDGEVKLPAHWQKIV